jgi:hypothetical protein
MSLYTDLVYGTEDERPARRRRETHEHSTGDDMMDLGKMAVGGMVTVGVLGAMGNFFHRD